MTLPEYLEEVKDRCTWDDIDEKSILTLLSIIEVYRVALEKITTSEVSGDAPYNTATTALQQAEEKVK